VLREFFGGSREALLAQLGSTWQPARPDAYMGQTLRARAAAASASRGTPPHEPIAAAAGRRGIGSRSAPPREIGPDRSGKIFQMKSASTTTLL